MRKKHIVFSTYDDIDNPYYGGGGAYAVHEIAKELARDNFVTVVTGNYPNAKEVIRDGVKYKRIGLSFGGPWLGQIIYHLNLVFLLLTLRFDVWIESFTPPFSTSFLPLFTKKPIIGLVHMLAGADMRRKYKIPFDLVERVGLKFYSHYIVMSQDQKKRILSIAPQAEVAVIPNGVTSLFDNRTRKKKIILFIGRIEVDQKGLDLLLTSFEKLKQKQDYRLVIAGSGTVSEENKLIKLINDKKLSKNVSLVGRVEGAKKKNLFNSATLIVICSRFETFSLVALESFSSKTPVVCFDIEGFSWVQKTIAKKINPFDVNAMAAAIAELLEDKGKRDAMAKRAYTFSQAYTWRAASEKYKYFIYSVCNQSQLRNKKAFRVPAI